MDGKIKRKSQKRIVRRDNMKHILNTQERHKSGYFRNIKEYFSNLYALPYRSAKVVKNEYKRNGAFVGCMTAFIVTSMLFFFVLVGLPAVMLGFYPDLPD